MDKQIVIKLDKLNCASKCCGTFPTTEPNIEDVDGVRESRQPPQKESKLRKLCCCCIVEKKN